jgi:hypothetical protein
MGRAALARCDLAQRRDLLSTGTPITRRPKITIAVITSATGIAWIDRRISQVVMGPPRLSPACQRERTATPGA